VRSLLFVLAAIATGCVLTTSLDGFATGIPGADADMPDVAPEAAVRTDGGTEAGPPLLVNEGFEDSKNCSPWNTFASTLVQTSTSHTGHGSCLVCSTGGGSFTIDRSDNLDPSAKVGDTYRATAWVNKGPSASQLAIGLTIRVFDNHGNELERTDLADPVALTDDWQVTRVAHTVTKTPGRINVFLYGIDPSSSNVCFNVDDITLEKL
jgi:hypothetical protein